jgi:hypothetical protein
MQFLPCIIVLACLFFACKAYKPAVPDGAHGPRLLFLVSVAGLYIELVLIRWIGTEVRVFAFVQNIVLISCFLGFGVGCLQPGKPGPLMPVLFKLAALALIVGIPLDGGQRFLMEISNVLTFSDALLWGGPGLASNVAPYALKVIVAACLVAAMLWLIAETIVPLGRWIGYCFDQSRNTIRTYTINLAGSLIGTWLLVALSVFSLPPAWWFALAFLLLLLATPKAWTNWMMGGLMLLPLLAVLNNGGGACTGLPTRNSGPPR